MKKAIMILITVLALLLSVSVATAAISVSSTYSSTAPTFGSSSQLASNPDADDAQYENVYATSTITIANSGTSAITISSVSISPASGFSTSDLNLTLVSSPSINANSSGSVQIKARVPEQLDAVDANLNKAAFNVGTVTLVASDGSQTTFTAYMQRENQLEIKKGYITIIDDNGEDNEEKVDDGDDFDEIKPGSQVDFRITGENLYSGNDNEDVKIKDITLTVESDDSDFDVDEDSDMGDIKADDDNEAKVSFTVDNDQDEGDYDVLIKVDGDDEHGAKHGEKWTISLTVERKSHELNIKTAALANPTVSCSRSTSIDVKVENIGSSDEDEVAILVTSRELGLAFKQENIELEGGVDSESWSRTIPIVVPESLKAGTYSIKVQTYYSGDDADGILADDKIATLTVEACTSASSSSSSSTAKPSTPSKVEVIDTPTIPSQGSQGTTPIVPTPAKDVDNTVEEKSFFGSNSYLVVLAIIVIAALAGAVLLVLKFLA